MQWDVFISHASDDKETVARPLAAILTERGCRVWLDETVLKLGDSLRARIDAGLAQSRYGVVILSRSFFSKDWPQRELNGLAARESISQKVLLPIWHGVDHDFVARFSPMLADKLAVGTDRGIKYVAEQVLAVVKSGDSRGAPAENETEAHGTSTVSAIPPSERIREEANVAKGRKKDAEFSKRLDSRSSVPFAAGKASAESKRHRTASLIFISILLLAILAFLSWHFVYMRSARELVTLQNSDIVTDLAWSPDGKRIAAGTSDKSITLWDSAKGDILLKLSTGERATSVSWNSQGKSLAVGGSGVSVWDPDTGKQLFSLPQFIHQVTSVSWSPDGKQLATSYDRGPIRILDGETGSQLFVLGTETDNFESLAWRPDGKRLASSLQVAWGQVQVWDLETKKKVLSVKGGPSFAWSPDGKRLVIADVVCKVTDADSGDTVFENRDDIVDTVTWSPDGERLATGSDGGSPVRILDAATGGELLRLGRGTEDLIRASWSPDGKRLATVLDRTFGRMAKTWNVSWTPGMP